MRYPFHGDISYRSFLICENKEKESLSCFVDNRGNCFVQIFL